MSIRLVLVSAFVGAAAAMFGAAVSAQAPEPQVAFSGNGQVIAPGDSTPSAMDGTDFGSTTQGVPVQRVFLVGNTGGASLSITGVEAPTGFTVMAPSALPAFVAPGGSYPLIVRCEATTASSFEDFLSVSTNDPDEGRQGFAIACRVNGAPELDVSGNGSPIADGDTTPSVTDGTDFGITSLNAPVTHVFRVTNRGQGDLSIGSVDLPAGYTALNALPSVIPPAGHADLQVRCNAASQSTFPGTVSILNSDTDEGNFTFAVRCTVGDGSSDFNPGPDDLPPSTSTPGSRPVTVPTPPSSSGGSTGSDGGSLTTGGNQQASAPVPAPTSTPVRVAATPLSTSAGVSSPTQGFFRPPSTGDAGLSQADRDATLPLWGEGFAAAALAVLATIAGARFARD